MDAVIQIDTHFASVKDLIQKMGTAFARMSAKIPPTEEAGRFMWCKQATDHYKMELQGQVFSFMTAMAPARLKYADARTREEGKLALRVVANRKDYLGDLRGLLCKLRYVLSVASGEAGGSAAGAQASGKPKKGKSASRSTAKSRKKPTNPNEREIVALANLVEILEKRITGVHSMNDAQAAREAAEAASRAIDHVDCERCEECDEKLVIVSNGAEARCPECKRVYELHGVVYEDAQMYSQEGQRSKSGQFSPNKHHTKWMNHILALEPETEIGNSADPDDLYGEKLLATLRTTADHLNIFIDRLDVSKVRKLLHTIDRANLYQNASLILKKLTGLEPPSLSEALRVKGGMMFTEVIQVLESVESISGNRKYYPYYIYKIYDLLLEEDDPTRFMLWFIHLQGPETLSDNDKEWRIICDELGWEWRPTNTAKTIGYLKFAKAR